MKDDFGARMKTYEATEVGRRLDVTMPICARIDGRRFSRFTSGFVKPFDPDLSRAMRGACAWLVGHTHARIGFVQSDEISLIWQAEDGGSVFFDGRIQKMCSVLAALATAKFGALLSETHAETVANLMPVFDARVWQVPSQIEAANVILWRAQDAKRNAVLSAGHSHFSPKQMHQMKQADVIAALLAKGIDFAASCPAEDRFGVLYQRTTREVELTDDIPEQFRPSGPVLRSFVEPLDVGYFGDVEDRVALIFGPRGEPAIAEIEAR